MKRLQGERTSGFVFCSLVFVLPNFEIVTSESSIGERKDMLMESREVNVQLIDASVMKRTYPITPFPSLRSCASLHDITFTTFHSCYCWVLSGANGATQPQE